ncbi:MAG: cytochrome c [Acidobacteria bacterium]|nr:cytochrome c [Acidobacteriota bacterium]
MRTSVTGIGLAGALITIIATTSFEGAVPPAGVTVASVPTYTKEIAPILNRRCVECHRAGMFAPMALTSYDEVRPWARAIKHQVTTREMPPWSADPRYGEFENDPRLTEQEIATIAAWADQGAPRGDAKDLPPPPVFPDGWTIGTPDVVFTMAEEFTIPASDEVPYQYFRIPTNFTEDKWVTAYEVRPGNRAVVHHVIASAQPGGNNPRDERTPGRVGLGGLTPNKPGVVLPRGVARRVPAGADIIFQVHYTANGVEQKDRTSIGLMFAKEPPVKTSGGGSIMQFAFVIPPGADNHEVRGSRTLTEDTWLTDMMPHMHIRGKDMTYTAYYPDGRSEILLSVPKYNFNWQITYRLKQPKLLPKGTRLEVVAHFDNSRNNPFNPDPTQTVRWGDQTWEEMMIGFYTTVRDLPAAAVAPQ